MNFINEIIPGNFINAAGWTIIDSLWQGAIIVVVLGLILLLLNKSSSKIRGMVSFGAMIIIFVSAVTTFIEHYESNDSRLTTLATKHETNTLQSFNVSVNKPTINEETDASFLISKLNLVKNYFSKHLPIIVLLWLIGILFFSLKLLGGFIYTQRLKHFGISQVPKRIMNLAKDLTRHLEIKKAVQVFESTIVKVPVMIGYFKPVILLPLGMLSGLPQNQIEAILIHELAHIKRADYLFNIIQSFIEIVFFYHPVVWWISSMVRDERENYCDDTAIEMCGNTLTLAKALVNVNQFEEENPSFALAAVKDKKQLLRRIRRMAKQDKEMSFSKRIGSAFLLVALFLTAAFVSCSSGDEITKENEISVSTSLNVDDDKEYRNRISFDEDGHEWRVRLKDDKVVALYKDGKRIPKDEIYKYEDMVYEKLEKLNEEFVKLKEDLILVGKKKSALAEEEIKLDKKMKKLEKDLQESKESKFDLKEFKEDMKGLNKKLDKKINIEFNEQEFQTQLDEMNKKLKQMKKKEWNFNIHYNNEEFFESLDELKEKLKGINLSFNFDFDKEALNISMNKLNENLKDIDLDMSEFDLKIDKLTEGVDELSENLKGLDIDLKGLKGKIKDLDGFLGDVRNELINDGYLNEEDNHFEMEFLKNKMVVNGVRLPDSLLKKYKRIYKNNFGKEVDDGSTFRIKDD